MQFLGSVEVPCHQGNGILCAAMQKVSLEVGAPEPCRLAQPLEAPGLRPLPQRVPGCLGASGPGPPQPQFRGLADRPRAALGSCSPSPSRWPLPRFSPSYSCLKIKTSSHRPFPGSPLLTRYSLSGHSVRAGPSAGPAGERESSRAAARLCAWEPASSSQDRQRGGRGWLGRSPGEERKEDGAGRPEAEEWPRPHSHLPESLPGVFRPNQKCPTRRDRYPRRPLRPFSPLTSSADRHCPETDRPPASSCLL